LCIPPANPLKSNPGVHKRLFNYKSNDVSNKNKKVSPLGGDLEGAAMDSVDFTKLSHKQAAEINLYINNMAPAMVVQKTLRFIDGNFRAQGWQGATFQPWAAIKRKGTILVLTGKLRRGTNYTTSGRGEVRFYNNVPYAKAHNEGITINATVNVRGFMRRRFYTDEVSKPGARKPKIEKTQIGESEVRPFTRKMNLTIKQRQFMPYEGHESPVLNKAIIRELEKTIKGILKV
jgi:hypothetical protein